MRSRRGWCLISLVFAVHAWAEIDLRDVARGFRMDRQYVISELTDPGASEDETQVKRTIFNRIVCAIPSNYAQRECQRALAQFVRSKRPLLLDFALNAENGRPVLRTLARIFKELVPVLQGADANFIQSAMVEIGVIEAGGGLSPSTAARLRARLDQDQPWYQVLISNPDFQPYLPFVQEALQWFELQPSIETNKILRETQSLDGGLGPWLRMTGVNPKRAEFGFYSPTEANVLAAFEAGRYGCKLRVTHQWPALECSEGSPLGRSRGLVAYAVGSADTACALHYNGEWACMGAKRALWAGKGRIEDVMMAGDEVCIKAQGVWDCSGRREWSERRLLSFTSVERTSDPSLFDVYDGQVKKRLAISEENTSLYALAIERLHQAGLVQSLKIPRFAAVEMHLTRDGSLYMSRASDAFFADGDPVKSTPPKLSDALFRAWPLDTKQDVNLPFGRVLFSNGQTCVTSGKTLECKNPVSTSELDLPLAEIEGFIDPKCYWSKTNLHCFGRTYPIGGELKFHKLNVSEDVAKKMPWYPFLCVEGRQPSCFNANGQRLNFPFFYSGVDSLRFSAEYYCGLDGEFILCTFGVAPPAPINVGHYDQIYFLTDAVVVRDDTKAYAINLARSFTERQDLGYGVVNQLWSIGSRKTGDRVDCYRRSSEGITCRNPDKRYGYSYSYGYRPSARTSNPPLLGDSEGVIPNTVNASVNFVNSEKMCLNVSGTETCATSRPPPMKLENTTLFARRQPSSVADAYCWAKESCPAPPARLVYRGAKIVDLGVSRTNPLNVPCVVWSDGRQSCLVSDKFVDGAHVEVETNVFVGKVYVDPYLHSSVFANPMPVVCLPERKGAPTWGCFTLRMTPSANDKSALEPLPIKLRGKPDEFMTFSNTFCLRFGEDIECHVFSSVNAQLKATSNTRTYPGLRQVAWGLSHFCVLAKNGVECSGPLDLTGKFVPPTPDLGQLRVPPGLGEIEWIFVNQTSSGVKTKEGLKIWGAWTQTVRDERR